MPGSITFGAVPAYKLPTQYRYAMTVTLAGVVPVNGQQINWSSDQPTIAFYDHDTGYHVTSSQTDSAGIATIDVVCDGIVDVNAKITATLNSDPAVTNFKNVIFTKYQLGLNPDKIKAEISPESPPPTPPGHADATITFTAFLSDGAGAKIVGAPVTWIWTPTDPGTFSFVNNIPYISPTALTTDANGKVTLQLMSTINHHLQVTARSYSASTAQDIFFSTVDQTVVNSRYPAPVPTHIDSGNVNVDPEQGPRLPVRMPGLANPPSDNTEEWVVVNDKDIGMYGLRRDMSDIVEIPIALFDFSNQNSLCYFVQDAPGNATQSDVGYFTVSGSWLNRPDDNVRRLTQVYPHLDNNSPLVDLALIENGLNLTVDHLLTGPVGAELRANFYFNGFYENSSQRKWYLYQSPVITTLTGLNRRLPQSARCPRALALGFAPNRASGRGGVFFGEFVMTMPGQRPSNSVYTEYVQAELDTSSP